MCEANSLDRRGMWWSKCAGSAVCGRIHAGYHAPLFEDRNEQLAQDAVHGAPAANYWPDARHFDWLDHWSSFLVQAEDWKSIFDNQLDRQIPGKEYGHQGEPPASWSLCDAYRLQIRRNMATTDSRLHPHVRQGIHQGPNHRDGALYAIRTRLQRWLRLFELLPREIRLNLQGRQDSSRLGPIHAWNIDVGLLQHPDAAFIPRHECLVPSTEDPEEKQLNQQ